MVTAEKDPIYSRIAAAGESDSGKTYSMTMLASEIVGLDRTHILDTENRAKLYRSKFPGVKIIPMSPPFLTEKIGAILKSIPKGDLLIIDSASLFWDQINIEAAELAPTLNNNTTRVWAKLTPKWDAFKLAIDSSQIHIITTWKMKDSVVHGKNELVKKVVTRGGGKGLKFDYHLVFMMNEKRQALVMKDNYDLFSDWKEPKMITAEVGKKIAKWLKEN